MFGLCQIFEINTIVQNNNTRYTIRKMVLVRKWKKKCTTYTKKNILISKKNPEKYYCIQNWYNMYKGTLPKKIYCTKFLKNWYNSTFVCFV